MHAPSGSDIAAWARHALRATSDLPDVHRVGLAMVEGGGRRLRFTASDRLDGAEPEWCHIDAYDDVPLNAALRKGEVVLGGLDDLESGYPAFISRQRGTATAALAAVPMVAAGQTVGAFVLFYDRGQEFDAGQQEELAALGGDLGAALRDVQRHQHRAVDPGVHDVPAESTAASHEVPGDPAAVGVARRFLRKTLEGWGVDDDTTDTAVLCLSELVTNAVIHTHGGCVVRVVLERGVLTTSVRDFGAQTAAVTEPLDDPLRVHGRGLQLVEALATRWGSTLDTDGTTVWFVLDLD